MKKTMPQTARSNLTAGNGAPPKSAGASVIDVLVSAGTLTPTQAAQLRLKIAQTGKTEEEVLRAEKIVSEEELARSRAALFGVPFVDLESLPISPEAISLLPQSVAARLQVVPLSLDKGRRQLSLAMADPLNMAAIEFVEQKTGLSVRPLAAVPRDLAEFISQRYSVSLATEVTEALREAGPEVGGKTLDLAKIEQVIREAPIARVVKELLTFAVRSRASDIHVEPEEGGTRIRYRIDGILQEKFTMPRQFHDSLISRIKILSGMKIDEKRVPQDGRFNFRGEGEEVDLRVSSLPIVFGEKIVMRLLKKSGGVPTLPELGLRGVALKNLEEAILRPHGIIIVCGPTGSGKTTTLYSILSRINTSRVNIITLEDPVEYQITGVNQVQVNPAAGLTFASGLRSFLRQDPNIIMVGEIRDAETTALAIQAALTGHLVFSTLHTNNAAGALPRLLDMGAEPFLLASTMTAVVAQRVVRRIHADCKVEFDPPAQIVAEMKTTLGPLWPASTSASLGGPKIAEPPKLYRGKGDPECGSTGYLGRLGIFEVMPVSEGIGKLILEHAPASSIEKQARAESMIAMKQDGYLKALEGITTADEVLRVAQE